MTTPNERAELLMIICGSKEKALEVVREEMSEQRKLRAELKRLRDLNDNRFKGQKKRDYDEMRESSGYECALDHISEFLDDKPFPGWS